MANYMDDKIEILRYVWSKNKYSGPSCVAAPTCCPTGGYALQEGAILRSILKISRLVLKLFKVTAKPNKNPL